MKNPDKYILLVAAMLFTVSSAAAELDGTLSRPRGVNLGFVVAGVVDSVQVQTGSRVDKDDLLVQLEQRPFRLEVNRTQAGIETIEPLLFDAKIELDQAQELYDRTVLSQVELQRVEARHRGLQAKSRMAEAEHDMAKWRLGKARLTAPFDALVTRNGFDVGQVISDYNKGEVSLRLVPVDMMAVDVSLNVEQRTLLSVGKSVQVEVDGDQHPGVVRSLSLHADEQGLYHSVIEFKYPRDKHYYSGQGARVVLP